MKLSFCFRSAALALALGLASGVSAAHAEDGLKVSGSMRLRYETVENQVRPGFNASDELISTRINVLADYRRGPLRLVSEIYDSRAWGADRRSPISTNEVNTAEVIQAYAALEGKAGALGASSLQAGRFTLNLGSRRLVAADDYRNTTNSYQGVRLDIAPAGIKTTLIYVQPLQRLPDDLDGVLDNRQRPDHAGRDLELWGGVAAKANVLFGAKTELSYFHLSEDDRPGRPTRNRKLDTWGGRIIRDPKPGRWDFEAEALRQTGHLRTGLGAADPVQAVRAGFLHVDAGYTWAGAWTPRLSAEFDLATGDKPGGRNGRFDTLFGSRRAELAPSAFYNAIGRTNLLTPGLRLEIAPSPRWDAFMVARMMWLEASRDSFSTTGVRDASGRAGRFGGAQVEGRVRYWLVKDRLRLEADGVWLDKGRFLRDAPNSTGPGDERYLSLNITASF